MAITYTGLDSGAQVTRSFWRVTLGGGFALSDLLSGPVSDFTTWPGKVEQWRERVPTVVPAIAGPAAVSGSGLVTMQSRAVVDVQILGAEQGQSVSQVAGAMDRLVPRVDVLGVTRISSLTDAEGRSKALQDAAAQAERESFGQWVQRFLQKSALVLGAGVFALLVLYVFLTTRKRA